MGPTMSPGKPAGLLPLNWKNSKDTANTCEAPVTQDNRCKTTQVVSALISTQEHARRIT